VTVNLSKLEGTLNDRREKVKQYPTCSRVTPRVSGFGVQGSGKSSEAGAVVFVILPQGRWGPAAIGFGHVPTAEFLINDPIFQPSIDFHLSFPNPEPRTLPTRAITIYAEGKRQDELIAGRIPVK
jgi:hypothetical protein